MSVYRKSAQIKHAADSTKLYYVQRAAERLVEACESKLNGKTFRLVMAEVDALKEVMSKTENFDGSR